MSRQNPRDVTRTLTAAAGIVIAVVLAVGGLALIGACVLVMIGISNFGSNK
jgi:hypothetical protein